MISKHAERVPGHYYDRAKASRQPSSYWLVGGIAATVRQSSVNSTFRSVLRRIELEVSRHSRGVYVLGLKRCRL